MTATVLASDSRTGVLARLRLRTRLYLGFASLIVVALVLAGAGSWGISELGGQVGQLEAKGRNVQRVLTAKGLLETIRRAQVGFMFNGDAASLTDMQAAQTSIKEVLAESAATTVSVDRLTIYKNVSAHLAEQVTGSAKLVEFGRSAGEARGRLLTGDDALTVATDKMMTAAW